MFKTINTTNVKNPNLGGTPADIDVSECGETMTLYLDGIVLDWVSEMNDFRTRIPVSDTIEISLTAEHSSWKVGYKNNPAMLFNIALINNDEETKDPGSSITIDFVTTYHGNDEIVALAEKIEESTGYDMSDLNYGFSNEEAATWMRKLRIFFANNNNNNNN